MCEFTMRGKMKMYGNYINQKTYIMLECILVSLNPNYWVENIISIIILIKSNIYSVGKYVDKYLNFQEFPHHT